MARSRYKAKKALTPEIRCEMEILESIDIWGVGIIPVFIVHVTNARQVRRVIRKLMKSGCITSQPSERGVPTEYVSTTTGIDRLATIRKQYKYVWGEKN